MPMRQSLREPQCAVSVMCFSSCSPVPAPCRSQSYAGVSCVGERAALSFPGHYGGVLRFPLYLVQADVPTHVDQGQQCQRIQSMSGEMSAHGSIPHFLLRRIAMHVGQCRRQGIGTEKRTREGWHVSSESRHPALCSLQTLCQLISSLKHRQTRVISVQSDDAVEKTLVHLYKRRARQPAAGCGTIQCACRHNRHQRPMQRLARRLHGTCRERRNSNAGPSRATAVAALIARVILSRYDRGDRSHAN